MDWVKDYDVVLLDFDGLLVDTEKVHFLAYETMLKERGYELGWSFDRYLKAAHHRAEGLQEDITAQFPELKGVRWETLYQEKREALLRLYGSGVVKFMKGAEGFLKALEKSGIERAVVTHSDRGQIELIKRALPLLNSIPNWVSRFDYSEPKPNPDCYKTALRKLGASSKRAIGFEDSPRGLKALMGASIKAVLVTEFDYPELEPLKKEGLINFRNLQEVTLVNHIG